MLTDIFAYRYENVPIWQDFREPERRLLVQTFKIVSEQLYPYWKSGKEDPVNKVKWNAIHDKLSMELGLQELSPKSWGYWTTWNGQQTWHSGTFSMDHVCKTFVCAEFRCDIPADRFMKERISFVEIAFREHEEEIKVLNANFQQNALLANALEERSLSELQAFISAGKTDGFRAGNEALNRAFKESIAELNERFRRAGCNLNYHNGFIQQSSDEHTLNQVETPFWALMSSPIWKNVDYDMKDAIDRRDTGVRDAAFYAARALESSIKIISDMKGWTIGHERGAASYIENLCNSRRGGNLIEDWEKEALKDFFSSVRNPIGHGAGSGEMRELSPAQTDWAIESCMSWIKSLVKRI